MGWSSLSSALEALVLLSPLWLSAFALLVWIRGRRERRWGRAVADSAADVLAACALLGIAALTLLTPGSTKDVELVPFRDMTASGLGLTGLFQNGGNVALFAPLGALLPLALGRRLARWGRVLAVAAAVSVTVEALQLLLTTGHVTSVDDVLLNCSGALLGAGATRPWWRAGPRAAPVVTRVSTRSGQE